MNILIWWALFTIVAFMTFFAAVEMLDPGQNFTKRTLTYVYRLLRKLR